MKFLKQCALNSSKEMAWGTGTGFGTKKSTKCCGGPWGKWKCQEEETEM